MGERQDIPDAFDLLLEEIEAQVGDFNEAIAELSKAERYGEVKTVADQAKVATDFRGRIASLRDEWLAAFQVEKTSTPESAEPVSKQFHGKLRKGLRTPEQAYRKPILEALVRAGGSAKMSRVLDEVFERMGPILSEFDHQPLSSGRGAIRWRNAAQWARNTLVKDGLMRNDSPQGTWEISEAGKKWLSEH